MNLFAEGNAAARKAGVGNENVGGELPLFAIGGQRNHRNSGTAFVCCIVADDNGGTDTVRERDCLLPQAVPQNIFLLLFDFFLPPFEKIFRADTVLTSELGIWKPSCFQHSPTLRA